MTGQPPAEWIARQIVEAFPWDSAPRYLIRDRDGLYSAVVTRRIRSMGIRDKPISPVPRRYAILSPNQSGRGFRYTHVIFLIDNGGYTIERGYPGKPESNNDIANWSYADLPKVFRRDTSARLFVVKTVSDLQNTLSASNDSLIGISQRAR